MQWWRALPSWQKWTVGILFGLILLVNGIANAPQKTAEERAREARVNEMLREGRNYERCRELLTTEQINLQTTGEYDTRKCGELLGTTPLAYRMQKR